MWAGCGSTGVRVWPLPGMQCDKDAYLVGCCLWWLSWGAWSGVGCLVGCFVDQRWTLAGFSCWHLQSALHPVALGPFPYPAWGEAVSTPTLILNHLRCRLMHTTNRSCSHTHCVVLCPCPYHNHTHTTHSQDVLTAGQGFMHRVAESGQLLFDRVRHADVLEYLWYLTRWGCWYVEV